MANWWRHCDVVSDCIVMNFLCNSPLYYLTLYQNLLRLNFIFVVRKIGKISPWWGEGGVCHPLEFSPCLILEPSRYIVENLVCKKSSSHSQEKKPASTPPPPPPPLAIKGLTLNIWIFRMNNCSYNQVSISILIFRPRLVFIGSKATPDVIKAQASDPLIFLSMIRSDNLNFNMRWPCSSMLSHLLACARFISCKKTWNDTIFNASVNSKC